MDARRPRRPRRGRPSARARGPLADAGVVGGRDDVGRQQRRHPGEGGAARKLNARPVGRRRVARSSTAFLTDDSIVPDAARAVPSATCGCIPDLDRLVRAGAQPGLGVGAGDRYSQDGTVHPRTSAAGDRRGRRARRGGVHRRAAFEIEWASPPTVDDFTPAARARRTATPTGRMSGLPARRPGRRSTGRASSSIRSTPSTRAGQYELSVAAEDPVGAADTSVLVRETIRASAPGTACVRRSPRRCSPRASATAATCTCRCGAVRTTSSRRRPAGTA